MRLGLAKIVPYSSQAAESIGTVLWLKRYGPLVQQDGSLGAGLRGCGRFKFALGYRSKGRLRFPRGRLRL